MTTINKVIRQVDTVKPNAYSDADKADWISRLEGLICRTVLKQEEAVAYEYPKDGDRELLVAAPFDDIYALYVYSMIDFNNREFLNYNNSAQMFNQSLDEYKKWYNRTNLPKSAANFRNVMG